MHSLIVEMNIPAVPRRSGGETPLRCDRAETPRDGEGEIGRDGGDDIDKGVEGGHAKSDRFPLENAQGMRNEFEPDRLPLRRCGDDQQRVGDVAFPAVRGRIDDLIADHHRARASAVEVDGLVAALTDHEIGQFDEIHTDAEVLLAAVHDHQHQPGAVLVKADGGTRMTVGGESGTSALLRIAAEGMVGAVMDDPGETSHHLLHPGAGLRQVQGDANGIAGLQGGDKGDGTAMTGENHLVVGDGHAPLVEFHRLDPAGDGIVHHPAREGGEQGLRAPGVGAGGIGEKTVKKNQHIGAPAGVDAVNAGGRIAMQGVAEKV